MRPRSGQDANAYSARNAAYDVAKLAGKKLLRRIDRSRRYAVDPPGIRTLCAYLLLREKIIKPLLAGIVCPRGPRPRHHTALDEHYIALRRQLRQTLQIIGLTAT